METVTPKNTPFFNPMTGWESASRFQAATFDWMAKAFQQWLALLTTVPPQFLLPPLLEPHGEMAPPTPAFPGLSATPVTPASPVSPAKAGAQGTRAARASKALDSRLRGNDEERALARAEPKRRTSRAKPKAKAKSPPRSRARG